MPCRRQAVAANGRPVQAVSSAAPPSCEAVLEPRRSRPSRPRLRSPGLGWSFGFVSRDFVLRAVWFGFRSSNFIVRVSRSGSLNGSDLLFSVLFGWVAGDCPKAEVVNNVTDVNANAIESLMYARGIDMLTPPSAANLEMIEVMERAQLADVTEVSMTWASHQLSRQTRLLVEPCLSSSSIEEPHSISRALRIGRGRPRLFPCTCCSCLSRFRPGPSRLRRNRRGAWTRSRCWRSRRRSRP